MAVHETGASDFGAILRRYRNARRMSQLDLANTCEISARHLSFLESGRSQPSREMVLQIGAGLLLPRSARNALLQAAGFAPAFPASPLASQALGPFRAILNEMMERHTPNPALLVDRHWNVHEANASARTLLAALSGNGGEMNIVRMLTRGEHIADVIANLPEVLEEMASRLQLEALEAGDDPVFTALLAALEGAGAKLQTHEPRSRRPIVPLVINTPGGQLSFLSAIAHFGTSEDVTIRDLRLELLFPADDATRTAMTANVAIAAPYSSLPLATTFTEKS
ncbi:MAG: helix-turn-helix transcriptional regulator [Caulobacteraceae bacterium]|nr:helix-turn-helix transcriptional regulator [Caulobacteraceae bacterium]